MIEALEYLHDKQAQHLTTQGRAEAMSKAAARASAEERNVNAWGELLWNDFISTVKRAWRKHYGRTESTRALAHRSDYKIVERLCLEWRRADYGPFQLRESALASTARITTKQVQRHLRRLERLRILTTDRSVRPHRYSLQLLADGRLDQIVQAMHAITLLQWVRLAGHFTGHALSDVPGPVHQAEHSLEHRMIAGALAA